ncbi:MAG: UPF0158 family protein [Candidatus Dormibacteraceae bacterium]
MENQRDELRGVIARRDGAGLITLLRRRWAGDALQLIGDGLLAAQAEAMAGAEELARRCAADLRERDWAGDEELADQIGATLGVAPASMLRPVPVELGELSMLLEDDQFGMGGRVDLDTGVVWSDPALDYAREQGELTEDDLDDPDRWLLIDPFASNVAFDDMEAFVDTVDDPRLSNRLAGALRGRGPFRHFKDALAGSREEHDRWYGFAEERQLGRARAWMAENGHACVPGSGK